MAVGDSHLALTHGSLTACGLDWRAGYVIRNDPQRITCDACAESFGMSVALVRADIEKKRSTT